MKKNRWRELHIFRNETNVNKLFKSLDNYNKNAYYQLCIPERFRELVWKEQEDGTYRANLHTDKLFEKVYGKCYVVAQIRQNNYNIINIEPRQLFLDGYRRLLKTYRGIPYRNKQDLDKLKIAERIIYGETER